MAAQAQGIERSFKYVQLTAAENQNPPVCIACDEGGFVAGTTDHKARFMSTDGGVAMNIHKICLVLFLKFKKSGYNLFLNQNGDTLKEVCSSRGTPYSGLEQKINFYDCTIQVFSQKPDVLENIRKYFESVCESSECNFGKNVAHRNFCSWHNNPFSTLDDYAEKFAENVKHLDESS